MTDPEPLFETSRLICRKWTKRDLEAIQAVYSDADAMRFVGDGKPLTSQQCRQWLNITLNNYQTRGYGMYALDLKEQNLTVGFAGFVHPDNQNLPELKYAFKREYWGLGLATEVARVLVEYGQTNLGIDKIIATVDVDHQVSQRILVTVGFRQVAERFDASARVLVFAL